MNLLRNLSFLSHLTYENLKEYTNKRIKVHSDAITRDSIYWYGHATTVINLSNTIIVTDPVTCNLLGYFKRIVNRPLALKKQKIDYILLSHGHMDHLNFTSLYSLDKSATVIVPCGYKRIIKFLGYKNVIELKDNDIFYDGNVKITAMLAEHDGRRFYIGKNKQSNSYLIEKYDKTVFFAGDTAYTTKFDNLKCDAAIMPVGCYKPERFAHMHCSPEESYKMFKNMRADAMIPIHYKTFKISLEDFNETYKTLKNFKDDKIKLIDIGQTYKITDIL